MPTLNYQNAGAVVGYDYLHGTITALYPEDDTADVSGGCGTLSKVPIFYHCEDAATQRTNGALVGASAGFDIGDAVVVMVGRDEDGIDRANHIIAHYDGVQDCGKWVRVKINGEYVTQTQLLLKITDSDGISDIVVTDKDGFFKTPAGFSSNSKLSLYAYGGSKDDSLYDNSDFSDGLTDWVVSGSASVESAGRVLIGVRTQPDPPVNEISSLSQAHVVAWSADSLGQYDNIVYCYSVTVQEVSGTLTFGPLSITEEGTYSYFQCSAGIGSSTNRSHQILLSTDGITGYAVVSLLTCWSTNKVWNHPCSSVLLTQMTDCYGIWFSDGFAYDDRNETTTVFSYWESVLDYDYTLGPLGSLLYGCRETGPIETFYDDILSPLYLLSGRFYNFALPGYLDSYSFAKKVQYIFSDIAISAFASISGTIYGKQRTYKIADFEVKTIRRIDTIGYNTAWCDVKTGPFHTGTSSSHDAIVDFAYLTIGMVINENMMVCPDDTYYITTHEGAIGYDATTAKGVYLNTPFTPVNALIFSDENGIDPTFSPVSVIERYWSQEYFIYKYSEQAIPWPLFGSSGAAEVVASIISLSLEAATGF